MERLPYRRVVMATEFWHGGSGRALAEGLRLLGWDVEEVDVVDHLRRPRGAALRAAMRVVNPLLENSYNQAILDSTRAVQADIMLTCKGSFIHWQTIKRLKQLGVTTVLHYPDVHFDHPGIYSKAIELYDLIVSTKNFHLDYLKKRLPGVRVFVHPHGYCPLAHQPRIPSIAEDDYEVDIGFLGNYNPYKANWLTELAMAMPDASMRIVGHGWRQTTGPLAGRVLGYGLQGDYAARSIQTARVNIAVHSGPVGKMQWQDAVSTRTFEIPACKGFMLHIDNNEVRALFSVPNEIDVFSSASELAQKVRFYLDRPDVRARMIDRAFGRTSPAYSYHTRAFELAREILALETVRISRGSND